MKNVGSYLPQINAKDELQTKTQRNLQIVFKLTTKFYDD